jgi:hypothetical protein
MACRLLDKLAPGNGLQTINHCKTCRRIEKNGQAITTGRITMKKISSAEWLAAVAIITSATVMQIREHMQTHDVPSANPAAAAQLACETTHSGLVLAACEPTRSEAPAAQNRATRHLRSVSNIWV